VGEGDRFRTRRSYIDTAVSGVGNGHETSRRAVNLHHTIAGVGRGKPSPLLTILIVPVPVSVAVTPAPLLTTLMYPPPVIVGDTPPGLLPDTVTLALLPRPVAIDPELELGG